MTTPREVVRVLMVTASGSLYAIRHDPNSGWWLRARAVPSRNAPMLSDVWRPIHQPSPWPPMLGAGVYFAFRDEHTFSLDLWPGLVLKWDDEWRMTTAIRAIHTWSSADAWPGEPTDEPKEQEP